ncbi:MAG: response regulator transcription factor [Actinomycetota bacterium]|nr:response regulator transcription factor [Actinomycetota bacterium]
MIRVLLVDDQSLLRMGFRLILEAEPDIEVIGEAADGETGVSMASALHPDVVLMDVRMPGMDGIQATASITAGPASKVLILTTFDLDQYVFAGLKAGASGFLLKDAPPAELLSAIRTVANGDAVLAPTATRRLIDQFVPLLPDPDRQHHSDDLLSELTDRERTVFGQLATGRSNREIATELRLSEGTVKIHVGRILAKLDLRDRVQAVVLAYESGLITPGNG